MASTDVLKEGFLVKKGHFRTNWRTRWFVLTKAELFYYRKKSDKLPAGVICLIGATLACPPLEASKKPWLLQITTHEGKEYLIHAPDKDIRDEWKGAIEDAIRKLDPAKMDKEMSPTRTITRTESYASTSESYREIVEAMQDQSAGLKLQEFKIKGARQSTHYFNGKQAINWLLSWSFASSRSEAATIATEMLRYGFFNPVRLDNDQCVCLNMKHDSIMAGEFADSEDATYIFVVFAPPTASKIFDSVEDSDDSDSDDDLLVAHSRKVNSVDLGDGKILKQGFMMKKGKVRHNWKARKFVLKEKDPFVYYFKGSKIDKPVGVIPLKGLTAQGLDDDQVVPQTTNKDPTPTISDQKSTKSSPPRTSSRTNSRNGKPKINRLVLITANGVRYVLEAPSADERDSWLAQLRVASRLLS